MTEGIIQKAFNDWRDAIREYMRAHGMIDNSEVVICYAELFKQLELQERDLVQRIKPLQVSKYQPYAFIDDLIGDSQE